MITVSEPLADQLRRSHGKIVTVLTNGFDQEDYNRVQLLNRDRKIRIVYTGNIYRHKRDPSLLFKAVKDLLREEFLHKNELRIDFYGRELSWAKQICYKMNMEEHVRFHGIVPYEESIKNQMGADILLLLEWTDKRATGVYTGKIFEYLGAKKPILAIGTIGGAIDQLLRETGAGRLVSDTDEAKGVLKAWITALKQKGVAPYGGNYELIFSRYNRQSKAKELAHILNDLTKNESHGDS
jgi:hypothetical protein